MRSVFFLLITALLFSCTSKGKLDVEVSALQSPLRIDRFDRELLEADLYSLESKNKEWMKRYGVLYESFLSQMIRAGSPHDPMIAYRLERFVTDTLIQKINLKIKQVYGDFSPYEQELSQAFAYYQHYYPQSQTPIIIPFYSGFNAKTFPYRDTLGIGLDMFLGANEEITQRLPPEFFPQYLKEDMDPSLLTTETMKNWIYSRHSLPGEYENNLMYGVREDFLATLVYHGKMMLLLQAILPQTQENIRFGFSKEELEWCEKNEAFIYQNLVEFKLVYSKNNKEMQTYVNPGAFTPGLPNVSPGEIGKWIGYKMVKSYFDEESISVQDLVKQTKDERKILSKYRP